MNLADYLDALRRNGGAFADAAEAAGLSARVEACPDWSVADLVWHLGEVHDFWRTVAEERIEDPSQVRDDLPRPGDDELVAWYRDGVERLHAVLAAADPSTPVWTWTPQKNIGFIQRRMCQETAVHRWDAEQAGGREYSLDPVLAVDGIDEFLDYFIADVRDDADLPGGSVHLHATDAAGEWLVTYDNGDSAVHRHHAKGDAAVQGTASDLLLLLWRRRSPADVTVFGDVSVLDRFLIRTDLD
jgi:uncharacterized protein (TIGR03083 family)